MMWTLAALGAAILIIFVGFLSARDLPEKQKRSRLRKFAAFAMIPLILTLLLPHPFVAKPYASTPPPASEAGRFEPSSAEQAKEIRRLQEEVFKLRTDLAEVNDYYRHVTSTALFIALGFLLSYSFRKNDEEEVVNRTPLGLNDDDKQ